MYKKFLNALASNFLSINFTFYLIDKEGVERKVYLHKAKPQDFDKSEQIVVIGKMQEDGFHAKDILTKCPSKYSDAQTTEVK